MIDRDKVARAIYDAEDPNSGDAIATTIHLTEHIPPHGTIDEQLEQVMETCRSAADAAIASVLEQLREPVLELASDLEAEVRHRWGDDIRLAHKVQRDIASAVAVRAFLQPPDSSNPAE